MKEKKTMELVGSMIGAIIGLIIVNTVALWRGYTHGVVLESWNAILWAANLSMVSQIAGNMILIIYRPARFYSFIQMIVSALGLLSIFVFYGIYPLDFSQIGLGWINLVFKVLMIVGMVGGSIGVIVYLVRSVAGTPYKPGVEQ
jgi:hypothetical protein